jgi:CRP-like cAMP-binding protein
LERDGQVSGHSHQELADMLGASRETVSRALVDLKAAGVLTIDRRCVHLLDKEALLAGIEREH